MFETLTDQPDFSRRQLLRAGVFAGLGAALAPRLAFAEALQAGTAPVDLMPNVRAVIERWVGPGKLPGMVATLGVQGQPTQFQVRGTEGFVDLDPVTPDSLFRIYSMTKPITGMAAMILIDEGKLGLDQPLADILPKYARMNVQVTPDGSLTDVRPARTQITMRHLMTHTAGLGYSIIQRGPIKAAYEQAGLVVGQISRIPVPTLERGKSVSSLEIFADRLADFPLVYEPGTKWSYSMGLDLLGRVIEVVSGKPFDRFLHDRIFAPAGMTSTSFKVPGKDARRLTTNYTVVAGKLIPIDQGSDSIYLDKPPFPFGGSGLVSSPRDYDRFLRMLANYGEIDGRRVMSEQAVRIGTSNLLPEGLTTSPMMGPVSHFGAGGRVGMGDETGVFGWAGAAGTVATVNMKSGVRSSLFVQFMPPIGLALLPEYAKALKADLAALATKA